MARDPHSRPADETPPVALSWSGLREAARRFAYLRPYRGKFIAAQACLLLASLTGLAFPYFTGQLIDGASRGLRDMAEGAGWPANAADLNVTALLLVSVLAV